MIVSSSALTDYGIIGYDNVVSTSNIASTTEATDFPSTNLANPSTSLKWRGTSVVADEFITITLAGQTVDYVGVARHNWQSCGASVSLQGDTGSGYADIIAAFTPTNDGPLIFKFSASASYIGIRVRLQPGTVEPEAAAVFVGQSLTLQRKQYVGVTPVTMARVVNAVEALSENGEILGRIVLSEHSEDQIILENLTPSWVRSSLDPFLRHAIEFPWFYAWRPLTYPNETGYAVVPSGANPKPVNSRSNGMMEITIPWKGITT